MVKNEHANTGDKKRCGFDSWVGKITGGRHGIAWRIPWTEEPGRLQSIGTQSQT